MKTTKITTEEINANTSILNTVSEDSFMIIRKDNNIIASISKFNILYHVSIKEEDGYFSGMYLDKILTMPLFDNCEVSFYSNIFEVIQ